MKKLFFISIAFCILFNANAQTQSQKKYINNVIELLHGSIVERDISDEFLFIEVKLPEYVNFDQVKMAVSTALNEFDKTMVFKNWEINEFKETYSKQIGIDTSLNEKEFKFEYISIKYTLPDTYEANTPLPHHLSFTVKVE